MAKVRLLTVQEAGEICFKRAIAVVGNAPEILTQKHGGVIDQHDLVIRMNAGVPHGNAHYEALGSRTDILTVGRTALLYKAMKFARPKYLWFMKLTKTGDQEWQDLMQHMRDQQWPGKARAHPDLRAFRWPQDQEDRVKEKVGADPSTGIRVLDLLQQWGRPAMISVFGCNWFGAAGGSKKSWWNMEKDPAQAHSGRLEYECFLRMGFQQMAPGHWRSRRFQSKKPASWDDR